VCTLQQAFQTRQWPGTWCEPSACDVLTTAACAFMRSHGPSNLYRTQCTGWQLERGTSDRAEKAPKGSKQGQSLHSSTAGGRQTGQGAPVQQQKTAPRAGSHTGKHLLDAMRRQMPPVHCMLLRCLLPAHSGCYMATIVLMHGPFSRREHQHCLQSRSPSPVQGQLFSHLACIQGCCYSTCSVAATAGCLKDCC